jgi:hypothetical protein
MPGIQEALDEIRALQPNKKIVYTTIAKKHGVNRSTLSREHQLNQVPRHVANNNQQKLSQQQELDLAKYIQELSTRRLAPTRHIIQNFASSVALQPCSNSWVTRFQHRYHDRLTSQWTTGMDSNRHNAKSGDKYKLYFELLQQEITQYKLEPEHTYSIDKKGFAIGVLGRTKRVFSRRQYEKKEIRQARQDSSREWVSLLACICANSTAVPPGLIFASKNSTIQSR